MIPPDQVDATYDGRTDKMEALPPVDEDEEVQGGVSASGSGKDKVADLKLEEFTATVNLAETSLVSADGETGKGRQVVSGDSALSGSNEDVSERYARARGVCIHYCVCKRSSLRGNLE